MKDTIKLWLSLYLALVPWAVDAQIYLCKTASGQTISSDRLMPECSDRPVREFASNGALKRDIPAPLTAEEKHQRQQEEAKRKLDLAALEQQKKNDRAIIERYSTEADVEKARKRAIDTIQEQIKKRKMLITAANKQVKQVTEDMELHSKKKNGPPAELHHKLEQAKQMEKEEALAIATHEADIVQVNERYDQTLQRFRELMSKTTAKRD